MHQRTSLFSIALSTVFAAALSLVLVLGGAAAQQATPTEIDEQQLKSFAGASLQIQEIMQNWEPRIQSAEDDAQREELIVQAESEMTDAVEAEGLDVPTYNMILAAAQQDPDLANRILTYQRELQ